MELAEQGQSVAVRTSARTPFIHPAVHADGETAAPPRRPRAGMFDAIADLERFAHKVSHDLGGPLHSMRMLTELIQARLDEGDVPQAREWVSMIGEHSQRLGRLVGAMSELLLTAAAVPQLQRVALGDLVAAVRREPALIKVMANPFALTPGFKGPRQPGCSTACKMRRRSTVLLRHKQASTLSVRELNRRMRIRPLV